MRIKSGRSSQFRRLFKNKLAAFGLVMLVLMCLAVIFAPLLTDKDPYKVDLDQIRKGPQEGHPMGTDFIGRDVFARILYGGRISIIIGLASALGSALVGIALGCIGGFIGGWFDAVFLRISEFLNTFPSLIIYVILLGLLGRGLDRIVLVFILLGWTSFYRLVRARFFSIREETFIIALQALRIPKTSIMFRHMLPNTMGPVLISFTMNVGGFVLSEAGMSFLGFGVLGTPTWGSLISDGSNIVVLVNYWWLWIPPGVVISLFVLAINFFGDGLRDVLDPKQSRQG